jgi:hypothetical protein
MNSLFSTLSASEAQELRGGEFIPSNGTGSNAGGTRNPASEAGYSEEKGRIPDYTGNGNHWGWIPFISGGIE